MRFVSAVLFLSLTSGHRVTGQPPTIQLSFVYLFVSSETTSLTSHTGGLSPFDDHCLKLAMEAGLPGLWIAGVSSREANFRDRALQIFGENREVKNLKGDTLASSVKAFFDEPDERKAALYNEKLAKMVAKPVTASDKSGIFHKVNGPGATRVGDCDNWRAPAGWPPFATIRAQAASPKGAALHLERHQCQEPAHLYCLGGYGTLPFIPTVRESGK